ncbi:MAG: 3-deoxy-D-manno-octulosonic acid transferase [Rhodospirillaceae bacterium]|nr:3-deoxy-D-manno-octulosonic acid transferase [Rhodospirillaceae bacterium]
MSGSLMLGFYRFATALAAPAMPVLLRQRIARGKEDQDRWRERFGETATPRPAGPLIWCHAASVGETSSVLPLITALADKGFTVLLTTGTVTSARMTQGRLPLRALHQYAPHDHAAWVARFLDHWRPGLALRVDSEIWPNTITLLRQRGVPIVQVNARMSEKAFDGWSIFPSLMTEVFAAFDLVCAQSDTDRAHFEKLGARKAVTSGNLKLAQPPLPCDAGALQESQTQAGNRPTWTAASIHPGEDIIVGRAHLAVKAQRPGALLYVVPRHAERGSEMTATLRGLGLKVAQRSAGDAITANTDVYMADTMGELGLFYR